MNEATLQGDIVLEVVLLTANLGKSVHELTSSHIVALYLEVAIWNCNLGRLEVKAGRVVDHHCHLEAILKFMGELANGAVKEGGVGSLALHPFLV